MLAFGSTAIWLGYRRYDRFGHCATIIWGVLAILLIVGAAGLQPPSMQRPAEILFMALLMPVVGAVPIVAVLKGSSGFSS